ncbi:hypothetical protein AS850_14990 [Frondihabitans sp. 762G35]|uniref:hypothetical protein n=1 Tax=Frondihabitans sp. 762G35 TaxID=1446794 RepID=UPI000D222C21|nr:hypothetical protein [Frondihabitans sp. 762G35]ARC58390.1 hypothetical protein AS850_14990 [Frondihabitans sp. 762G35]
MSDRPFLIVLGASLLLVGLVVILLRNRIYRSIEWAEADRPNGMVPLAFYSPVLLGLLGAAFMILGGVFLIETTPRLG